MIKKRLVLLLVFSLLFSTTIYSKPSSNYSLGTLKLNPLKLVYQNVSINIYTAYDTHYIAVADLRQLGCIITHAHKDLIISTPLKTNITTGSGISVALKPYSFYSGTIQFGNLQTHSLYCDGRVFIPLDTLNQFGTLTMNENTCTFIPGEQPPVVATETSLKSFFNETLEVSLLDIYWNNKVYLRENEYILEAGQIIDRIPQVQDADTVHIATIVTSAKNDNITFENSSCLGQINTPLLEEYSRKVAESKVVLDYGHPLTRAEVNQIESLINAKHLSSPTKYLVWTNISNQLTYIFEGSENNWKLVKCFLCSTGKDVTPTPKGIYALTYKVPSFGQNKGYCCKYAFGFIGTTYLYHSIIFDVTGSYLLENKGVLGKKASQGCIRFSVENAKWFYDHLTSNTTVYIS